MRVLSISGRERGAYPTGGDFAERGKTAFGRTQSQSPGAPDGKPRRPSSFLTDERGGISMFVLVLFILMLVVSGMAMDYQHRELVRADIQDALDRGTLAAANKDQLFDGSSTTSIHDQAKELINAYLNSRVQIDGAVEVTTEVTPLLGGRRVASTATAVLDTTFLNLIGIGDLQIVVRSTAIQSIEKLNIVLVLDVSGSMGWNSTSAPGTKLAQLKIAAKEFVDTVLQGQAVQRTLISIVPFSQQVALPRSMSDLYNVTRHHNYSSCFDYHSLNFNTRTIPTSPATPYKQGQHFRESSSGGVIFYGCPKSTNVITAYSNNATTLKNAIDTLTVETWTATYMGMKWGTHLLDPSARPVVNAKIASGEITNDFAGWPADWSDSTFRNIIVLMSDGQNTRLNEIKDWVYNSRSVTWWNYNWPRRREKISIINSQATGQGDVLLKNICDQAKLAETATIYTVGFELSNQPVARAALEDCSSALSTHYLVEGNGIVTAFQNIAKELTTLKLVN